MQLAQACPNAAAGVVQVAVVAWHNCNMHDAAASRPIAGQHTAALAHIARLTSTLLHTCQACTLQASLNPSAAWGAYVSCRCGSISMLGSTADRFRSCKTATVSEAHAVIIGCGSLMTEQKQAGLRCGLASTQRTDKCQHMCVSHPVHAPRRDMPPAHLARRIVG